MGENGENGARRISVSAEFVEAKIAGIRNEVKDAELRIIREIHSMGDRILGEEAVRDIARQEISGASRTALSARSFAISALMFLLAISSFLYTLITKAGQSTGHGGG